MDRRKNANVTKGNIFKMEWIHSDYLETFLKHLILIHGSKDVLNLCSGSSRFGSERIDIINNSNVTTKRDMFEFLRNAKRMFDFIYIDPPFKYYNPGCKEISINYPKTPGYGDPFEWQYQALSLAKKALILKRNLIMTNWSGNVSKFQEYFLIRDSRPSAQILEVIWK